MAGWPRVRVWGSQRWRDTWPLLRSRSRGRCEATASALKDYGYFSNPASLSERLAVRTHQEKAGISDNCMSANAFKKVCGSNSLWLRPSASEIVKRQKIGATGVAKRRAEL